MPTTVRITVNPTRIPFLLWADTVTIDNTSIPRAMSEDRWKDWALSVTQIDASAPDPRTFSDWRQWALSWVNNT